MVALRLRAPSAVGIFDEPAGPLEINLTASRTSGPAPLYVFFDATATTHSGGVDTFRNVGYSWNFGDVDAGIWTYDGLNSSKNIHRGGPLAAHVFETPGTYTVKVRGRDPSGNQHQTSVVITVDDPDSTFATTSTVFISTNSDTTGCPSGATQRLNATSWPTWANNTRYILHDDQDFRSLTGSTTQSGRTNVQIIRSGAGTNRPITNGMSGSSSSPNTSVTWWGLDMRGRPNMQSGTNLLFGRNLVSNSDTTTAMDGPELSSGNVSPVGCCIYELTISTSANPGYGLYTMIGRYGAILGVDINAQLQYHCIRVWNGYKSMVQHSRLGCLSGSGFDHFKWHSEGLDEWSDTQTGLSCRAAYISFEENQLGNGTESFSASVTLEPQNDQSAEGLEYVLMANNRHKVNVGSDYRLGGRYMVARGNFMDGPSGSPNYNTNSHSASLPAEWRGPYYTTDSNPTFADPV